MTDTQRLLELALKGLEADRVRIDDEIAQITKRLGGSRLLAVASPATGSELGKKRTMSAAARKKISEGMKRRYASLRTAIEPPNQKKKAAGGGLSAVGRKKLSDAMKARWAAKKKAAKKAS